MFLNLILAVFDSNFMLLTDLSHDRIIQVDIDTGTLVKLPFAAIGATGIAYEKLFDTIFFTSTVNTFTSKVMSVSLHGKKGIVTYATGKQVYINNFFQGTLNHKNRERIWSQSIRQSTDHLDDICLKNILK